MCEMLHLSLLHAGLSKPLRIDLAMLMQMAKSFRYRGQHHCGSPSPFTTRTLCCAWRTCLRSTPCGRVRALKLRAKPSRCAGQTSAWMYNHTRVQALEKYVMTKLYSCTFGVSTLDQERDELLTQRMTALAFIQPGHLDIPEAYCNENSWVLAQRELLRINTYKAPRDKLVCILNCCRIINNLLHTGVAAGDGKGADDFLPILIFVTIHANPPKLASNLEYIQRYRMQSRMMAEAAYFFTQMVRLMCRTTICCVLTRNRPPHQPPTWQYSAASFVETINANSLTIDPDEFVARMIAAGIPDTGAEPVAAPASASAAQEVPPSPSPSVVRGVEEQYGSMPDRVTPQQCVLR